ncbi:hypothetical protein [Methylobacterium sp. J-076]|uniref:hypothetical protein n=1 Tax=Methylobacterium sp. J-076 TaxID=2836655 RepID=UPI001FBA3905|nr:hypothetical protein [Methylobacterium sp. J-076]MCJ2012920.1 hypothetical protein [Methylobacterium sp. J-076]
MLNFTLGAVAGALIAGTLTIAAARQPELQTKLGLITVPLPMTPAAARPVEPQCRQDGPARPAVGKVQEILFNRQRFWSVAP